jgi:glutamate synthase (NADPH/NADH) small chain
MNDRPSPDIAAKLKYAWRDVLRVDSSKRPAAERLADFLEIYGHFDEATAREQASRCIQCPDPQCVTGCPLGNRIPEWLALTAEGQFSEAAAVLHSTSCLPEIAAKLCPSDRLCEARCILDGKAEPVSIRSLEQFLNEYAFAHGEADVASIPPNGFAVAVVGAGPGGLACAEALSRRGFAVTVFDWRLVAGGLLVSGTPAFRMEKSIVERRLEMLKKRGVKFRLGVKFGDDFTYAGLRADFDAIYLGFGARKMRELDLPGRKLKGVNQALVLLAQEHGAATSAKPHIAVAGKRVVVLGGGNMAMDCLRTALRAGAREAVCAYRRDVESLPCNHAEYENAVEEGVKFLFLGSPAAVLGNASGEAVGVRFLRTELGEAEAGGRKPFRMLPGTEFEIAADCVFLALGFEPVPPPDEDPFTTLTRNDRGGVAVEENQMTSIPGVFAGGDLVDGPSTVLNVVRDARRAAQGIEAHLKARAATRRLAGTPSPCVSQ